MKNSENNLLDILPAAWVAGRETANSISAYIPTLESIELLFEACKAGVVKNVLYQKCTLQSININYLVLGFDTEKNPEWYSKTLVIDATIYEDADLIMQSAGFKKINNIRWEC